MKRKKSRFTIFMFRIYRILVMCLMKNKKRNLDEQRSKVVIEIKELLEKNFIQPFEEGLKTQNDENAENYLEKYYIEGKSDNNICSLFGCVSVSTVRKSVERYFDKYDNEH